MSGLSSGIFSMVSLRLRKDLLNKYTLTMIKYVVENALFIKSSYKYVPVVLTHKLDLVKICNEFSRVGTTIFKVVTSTLFKMKSFTEEKYEVTLLQQSVATVFNEYFPQWTIEFFKKGLGIPKPTDIYCRQVMYRKKYWKKHFESFHIDLVGCKNYISFDSFPTEKRANSLIYFLSKLVILDLVRRPVSDSSEEFVKRKVKRDVLKQIKALDENARDAEFSEKLIAFRNIKFRLKRRNAKF